MAASQHYAAVPRRGVRAMRRQSAQRAQQRGSVLLIVLWTAALLTILVTAMASKVRLSARTAFNNQLAADDYTQMMSALHSAEMERIFTSAPPPLALRIGANATAIFMVPK